jgi:hypothetical protein
VQYKDEALLFKKKPIFQNAILRIMPHKVAKNYLPSFPGAGVKVSNPKR